MRLRVFWKLAEEMCLLTAGDFGGVVFIFQELFECSHDYQPVKSLPNNFAKSL